MDLMWLAVPLAWLTLMGAPILALVTAAGVRPHRLHGRGMVGRVALAIGTVAAAWTTGIEFIWRPINWVALSAAYFGWAWLVGCLFALRPAVLGVAVGSAALMSLLPGVLLGTVGLLGLLFIAGDYASPPRDVRTLAPGLDCVVTAWGSAVSDDGHNVTLYRYWPVLPLIRRQVRRVVVDETSPHPGIPATTGCREVAAMDRIGTTP